MLCILDTENEKWESAGIYDNRRKKIKYVIGKKKKTKKKRDKIYGYDVFLKLKKIWVIFDFICSKRLAPFMAEAVEKLEKHKEIDLTDEVREKLVKISPSTCFTRRTHIGPSVSNSLSSYSMISSACLRHPSNILL